MELNRKTAMQLWNNCFGTEIKVQDFAERTIIKGAYNDRKSKYGWNIDHILPKSKGGLTEKDNLICSHILTNDEKANNFPNFKANGFNFQIIKVRNHYEIKKLDSSTEESNKEDTSQDKNENDVNFYDSKSGIRFFKSLKGIQNKKRFVGSILICLRYVSNTAIIDFIEKFFNNENISYIMRDSYNYNNSIDIIIKNYNMPQKKDISELLDKCVLLNTYLGYYFTPKEYIDAYNIFFRMDYYNDKQDMYIQSQKVFDNLLT